MTKTRIEGLISQLHERIGVDETSPEQARLIAQMQSQLQGWEGKAPPSDDLLTSTELLLADIEEQHPKAAMVLREIMATLHHVGL